MKKLISEENKVAEALTVLNDFNRNLPLIRLI